MKRVTIVTGASGLVGSAVAKIVEGPILINSRKDVDLTSRDEVDSWVKGYAVKNKGSRVDIVHCAGNASAQTEAGDYYKTLQVNTLSLHNLVTSLHEHGLLSNDSRIVNMSSATVYGDTKEVFHDSPVTSNTFYSASKLSCEILGYVFQKMYDVKMVNLRLVAVVGENATRGMLHSVWVKCLNAYNFSQPEIHLHSNSIKPLVHSRDIAKLVKNILDVKAIVWESGPNHLNVGPEDNVSVENIVNKIWSTLNASRGTEKPLPALKWQGSWAGDLNNFRLASNRVGKAYYGWEPDFKTSLEAADDVIKSLVHTFNREQVFENG